MKYFVTELWEWFREQPRAVKVRFIFGLIPSLFLLGLEIIGAYAEKYNDGLICWIHGSSRYGKNLWGEKAVEFDKV